MPNTRPRTPLSLRPDARLIEAAATGNRVARAIAESWRFKFPVRTMTPEQLSAIDPQIVFTGHTGEADGRRG